MNNSISNSIRKNIQPRMKGIIIRVGKESCRESEKGGELVQD